MGSGECTVASECGEAREEGGGADGTGGGAVWESAVFGRTGVAQGRVDSRLFLLYKTVNSTPAKVLGLGRYTAPHAASATTAIKRTAIRDSLLIYRIDIGAWL